MSYQAGTPANNSNPAVDNTPINEERQLVSDPSHTPKKRSPWKWIIIGFLALAVVVVAVVVPVYYKVIKPRSGNSSSNSSGNGGGNGGGDPEDEIPDLQEDGAITGGDGSKIFTLEGEFTYTNPFGGTWYFDPADPLNDSAQAQSYTPPLNQSWTWGTDKVYGVNLGGWLVLEPFISPALFEKYSDAAVPPIDEYSLMEAKRADGTLDEIEEHYRTFITEKDFADIAGAGLNWIRLPIGFWAISTMENEPYYEGASWKYVLKAITWARKYGLRINLDLHAHPGSQNGWNHSGFGRGPEGANWLRGLMGIANAQRSLDYIRIITQFISQPQYSSVVQMFGIVNEPRIGAAIDRAAVETFNYQAYIMMREITGIGAGKGPIISIHDGFFDTTSWHTFLNGADRLALDTHPYFAFDGPNADPVESYVPRPCERWATGINGTQQQFGIITAGEWSAAVNDCGLFVTGVNGGPLYAGNCADWDDWASWDDLTKNALLEFTQASMDALQNWFFWTWRIGESLEFGSVRAPFWSYKLGYDNGWIPRDPRSAIGKCTELGVGGSNPFSGEFLAWQTGGDEAAQPTVTAPYVQWPPVTLGVIPAEAMAFLPTYTPTGTITTLDGPVFTGADVDLGDGWFDDDDTVGMMVPIAGCSYPDAYSVASVFPIPVAPVCGPGAQPLPSDPTLPEEVPIPTTITDAPIQTDTVITSDGIETTIAVPPV